MGIKDLSKLIADVAPQAIKEKEMKDFHGRKVAIDASISLYQCLTALDGIELTNASYGGSSKHLIGIFANRDSI